MSNLAQRLQAPFHPNDIEWRAQRVGIKSNGPWAMVLAYVTNRAIMARLDEVFGPMGWQNEYRNIPTGGVECGISIWNPELSQWITKWDAADNTQVEATKGGRSDSMKRAAVQWGIGRYLYNLEATFANASIGNPSPDIRNVAVKCNFGDKQRQQWGYWVKPQLPDWAVPQQTNQQ